MHACCVRCDTMSNTTPQRRERWQYFSFSHLHKFHGIFYEGNLIADDFRFSRRPTKDFLFSLLSPTHLLLCLPARLVHIATVLLLPPPPLPKFPSSTLSYDICVTQRPGRMLLLKIVFFFFEEVLQHDRVLPFFTHRSSMHSTPHTIQYTNKPATAAATVLKAILKYYWEKDEEGNEKRRLGPLSLLPQLWSFSFTFTEIHNNNESYTMRTEKIGVNTHKHTGKNREKENDERSEWAWTTTTNTNDANKMKYTQCTHTLCASVCVEQYLHQNRHWYHWRYNKPRHFCLMLFEFNVCVPVRFAPHRHTRPATQTYPMDPLILW